MTMHWIAQASASGGLQSIKYVVTAAWSGPTSFFPAAFFNFLGDALFSQTFFCFFGK
jgi:hypothetical protein